MADRSLTCASCFRSIYADQAYVRRATLAVHRDCPLVVDGQDLSGQSWKLVKAGPKRAAA